MAKQSAVTPGLVFASLRVFDLSLGEMLWSRRTVFMGLIVGLPVVLAVIVRLLFEAGLPAIRIQHQSAGGPFIFGMMMWIFFVRLAVPVLGVFYGTSLIADEVDDKTITYLFTRPIPRSAVLLGKYLAYLACTVFVIVPSVLLCWVLVVPIGGSLGASFPDLLKDLGLVALGLAVYGALFAFVGAVLKRPLLTGLLFVLGWEFVILLIPGYLKRLSVAYYLQGLVPHAMPSDSATSLIQAVFRESPTLFESLITLSIIGAVSLWLAARAVSSREYVLEQ
jgi:ABC-type transport system involved in multi-copper enzyme maturation permease subunit